MALFTLWRLKCSLHKPGDVEPIHKSEDEWWVPGTDPVIGFTPGTGFPERVLKQPGVGVPGQGSRAPECVFFPLRPKAESCCHTHPSLLQTLSSLPASPATRSLLLPPRRSSPPLLNSDSRSLCLPTFIPQAPLHHLPGPSLNTPQRHYSVILKLSQHLPEVFCLCLSGQDESHPHPHLQGGLGTLRFAFPACFWEVAMGEGVGKRLVNL